jgi:hypothetical protein
VLEKNYNEGIEKSEAKGQVNVIEKKGADPK